MSHEKLPHMRFPGRVVVRGNMTWLDPKGIPFNLTCRDNLIAYAPENFEKRPTDTIIEGDLTIQGNVYCDDLEKPNVT